MAAFLVMLREGVEAALIVAIVLTYLNKVGHREGFSRVWIGTGAAAAVSAVAGVIVFTTLGSLQGTAEMVTEGTIAFVAAGVLTWMIFWMARQARAISGQLQARIDVAIAAGSSIALGMVAFTAVAREGLESALFLISTTVGEEQGAGQLLGGVLGTLAAFAIGYLVYQGGSRLNLRLFFRITGVMIILFAAGLVAKGIHEFEEIDLLPPLIEHVWSLSFADPATSLFWQFMKSLFGWRPDPSLLAVLGYLAYLLPIGWSFLKATATPMTVSQPAPVG